MVYLLNGHFSLKNNFSVPFNCINCPKGLVISIIFQREAKFYFDKWHTSLYAMRIFLFCLNCQAPACLRQGIKSGPHRNLFTQYYQKRSVLLKTIHPIPSNYSTTLFDMLLAPQSGAFKEKNSVHRSNSIPMDESR